jgi:hypothetical protein
MGISDFWKQTFLYKLSATELKQFLRTWKATRCGLPEDNNLRIGVDIQIALHSVLRSQSNFAYQNPALIISSVLDRYQTLFDNSFSILFVSDSTRPLPSKLVGFSRRAERGYHDLRARQLAHQLSEISSNRQADHRLPQSSQNSQSATIQDADNSINIIQRKLKKHLRLSSKPTADLLQALDQALRNFPNAEFFTSYYQADSQLSVLFSNQHLDAIWSEDGDLLGISGVPFVIRGCQAGIFSLASLTSIEALTEFQVSSPKIPSLFQTEDSAYMRVLWCVILGTDYYPGGVKGVGPKKLSQFQTSLHRHPEQILEKITSTEREGILIAVEAALLELAFTAPNPNSPLQHLESRESLTSIYQGNRHLLLPESQQVSIISESSFQCANKHSPHSSIGSRLCTVCSLTFCELCIFRKQRKNPFKCLFCVFGVTPEEENLPGSPNSPELLHTIDPHEILSLQFSAPEELNISHLDVVSSRQMVSWLRVVGIRINEETPPERQELIALCRAVKSRSIPSYFHGTEDEQRRAIQDLAETNDEFSSIFPWAFPIAAPFTTTPLTDEWLCGLDADSLMNFSQIILSLSFPSSVQNSNNLPSAVSAMRGLVGSTLCDLACRLRPFGGAERILKMAIRAVVSFSVQPLTATPVHLSEDLLYLRKSVPKSMKAKQYIVECFLDSQRIVRFFKCTCAAGSGGCHHILVPLIQLEMNSRILLRSILNLFKTKASPDLFVKYSEHLFYLGTCINLNITSIEELRQLILPPNDLPQPHPQGPGIFQFFEDLRFHNPRHSLALQKGAALGDKNELTKEILLQYDPLASVEHRFNNYNWLSIFLKSNANSRFRASIGFAVITLRAHAAMIEKKSRADTLRSEIPSASNELAAPDTSAFPEAENPVSRKRKERYRSKCHFPRCQCHTFSCEGHWRQCPKISVSKNPETAKIQNSKRQKFLSRIGTSHSKAPVEIRICPCHPVDDEQLPLPYVQRDDDDSTLVHPRDRRLSALLESADSSQLQIHLLTERIEILESQIHESHSDAAETSISDPGLVAPTQTFSYFELARNRHRFKDYVKIYPEDFLDYLDFLTNGHHNDLYLLRPFCRDRVKASGYENPSGRTGFSIEHHKSLRKKLNVYDELVIYFARSHGKPLKHIANDFGISSSLAAEIFLKYLRFEYFRIQIFGKFLSWTEHQKLTSVSWETLFPGARLHLWDTTDISLQTPSDRDLQRATYSSYYGSNVAKGGVGMTLLLSIDT